MARAPKPLEEEPPAHDALDGIPSPRQTAVLHGHEAAERTFLDAYRSGRLHHGWILAGERGIGKATLAFRFARFLFAHPDPAAASVAAAGDLSVAPDHPAARKVAAGVHGNLLHLQRDWVLKTQKHMTVVSVEGARRIIPFLGSTAGEEGWRVVIIDPADDMTPSAENAILKNLEEPPKKTLFLLLARRRGGLLPTILSRCRVLDISPLAEADLRAVVDEVAPDAAAAEGGDLAIALAAGSPRRFIELQRRSGVEIYRLMLRSIETGDTAAQLRLATLAGDAAGMEQLLELFGAYTVRRVHGEPEPAGAGRPPSLALVTWAELWEKATQAGREVDTYNLDRKQFVLDLLQHCAAVLRTA